uniref:NIMA related kinase 3 n=1 Tax=Salarias fasciatus TaxID=181472 RepID=A0A672IDJ8_SALFA
MENYSLLKVIGEGSFGRAVLVRCKSSQEHYVMKEVQLPKNSRREAILLSTMKHPHIVAFREAFEADDLLCIVMEYCSRGDLLRRIQHQKTPSSILKWFAQMCVGAKHIHDKQVLHRDLKSKVLKIMGPIKLGDFGSACILNSASLLKGLCSYICWDPRMYVAPEIWDNRPYNNKSDVWSLGCVLYELCTLRHPAPSWKSLILKVCRGAYPPLPSRLPYELHHLVKQMFKTDPRDRPSLHTILTSHRALRLQHQDVKVRLHATLRWRIPPEQQ